MARVTIKDVAQKAEVSITTVSSGSTSASLSPLKITLPSKAPAGILITKGNSKSLNEPASYRHHDN